MPKMRYEFTEEFFWVYFAKRKNKIEYDLFSSKLLFIKLKNLYILLLKFWYFSGEAICHDLICCFDTIVQIEFLIES